MDIKKIYYLSAELVAAIIVVLSEYIIHIIRTLRCTLDGLMIVLLSVIYAFIPIKWINPKTKKFKHWDDKLC